MTIAYGMTCANRLANQGHIRAGDKVWLTVKVYDHADHIFLQPATKHRCEQRACVFLAGPPQGALPYRPHGKSAIKPRRHKNKSGPQPGA